MSLPVVCCLSCALVCALGTVECWGGRQGGCGPELCVRRLRVCGSQLAVCLVSLFVSVCRSCVSSSSVQRPPIPRWCPVRAWLFFTFLPTYLTHSQPDRLPQAARVPRLSGDTRAPPRAGRRLAADRQHLVRQCLRVSSRREVTRSCEIEPRLRGLSAGLRRPTSAEGSRRTYECRPGSYRDDKAVENSARRRAGPYWT